MQDIPLLIFPGADYKKIVGEQLVRNVQFFGADAQNKISNSFIIVAGVGGVGRYTFSIEPPCDLLIVM